MLTLVLYQISMAMLHLALKAINAYLLDPIPEARFQSDEHQLFLCCCASIDFSYQIIFSHQYTQPQAVGPHETTQPLLQQLKITGFRCKNYYELVK